MVYPNKVISAFDPTVKVNFDSSKIYTFMKLPFVSNMCKIILSLD